MKPLRREWLVRLGNKEFRLMRDLVGKWQVDIVRRKSDGSMMKGNGTIELKELSMDRGISIQARLCITGLGEVHIDAFCGIDPWTQKVHLYVAASGEILRDYVGEMRSETETAFRWEGGCKEKTATDSIILRLVSGREFDVHQLSVQDGREEFLRYKLKRE